ncbi:unnamed protein product [Medioppia subpectinata]|uniref:NR LBD domain-containing protein n=1 Tax=Medioppia subpectinata TaxID=1979941 RepID=A0A7R9KMB1_9ACAR|nr:unnamed protein product [Medioppia subpectinata]CAG2105010.1 unnamed protein product [Medioppia subpectinata]
MCHQSYGALTCDPCRALEYCDSKTELENKVTDNNCIQIRDIESTSCRDSTLKSKEDVICLYGNDGSDNIGIKHISVTLRGVIFGLNDMERCRLTQVFKSTAFIKDPVVRPTSAVNTIAEALRVLRMRTEIHCRRIIKMCKTMDEFTELCENDKIILLKTCCPEIICLSSVLTFDFVGKFWTVYIDSKSVASLSVETLKWGTMSNFDRQRIMNFMYKLNQEYNGDTNLMDLVLLMRK